MKAAGKFLIAAAAVLAAAVITLSLVPAVGNIISYRNGFAYIANHRVIAYEGGAKSAEIDVRELGNAKLVGFGKEIVVYSPNRGLAAFYSVSGDWLYDGHYDYDSFENTRGSRHLLADGSEVKYTKILCYEQIKLINDGGGEIIYNNLWLILTLTATFAVTAVILYLRIRFWKDIDEARAGGTPSTGE